MNGQMTAAVLYGKEDLKIERVPIPRVGDGEVLVKVQVALTCGTDLKVYQRGYHAPMIMPPALFGHGMAYDSARSRTVLFGGLGPDNGGAAREHEHERAEELRCVSP